MSLLFAVGIGWWFVPSLPWDLFLATSLTLILSIGFIICKGIQLQGSACFFECRTSSPHAIKIFCEGVFIQAFTWPGRVVADGYRIGILSVDSDKRSAISSIAFYRGSTIIGQVLACLLASSVFISLTLTTLLAVSIVLSFIANGYLTNAWLPHRWQISFRLVVLALMASICDALAFASLAWMLCGVDLLSLAAAYVFICNASTLSGLPLGIGVLDVSCVALLTTQYGVDKANAIQMILLYRALGPGLTLLFGGISLSHRWSKRRYYIWAKKQVDFGSTALRTAFRRSSQPRLLGTTRKAFTLVELVIVVLVLGILAAIATPRLFHVKDEAYLSSAKRLESNLQTAALTYLQQWQNVPGDFVNWVRATDAANHNNLIDLSPLRHNLQDPDEQLLFEDRIVLRYKNGMVAEYTIDENGNIEAEYTGPGVSGESGGGSNEIDTGGSEVI